ncbi:AraC family transcriptional regulator [Cellulomonas pakistanensis]|uniref:Cupin n=1 Tax=Cellulomonas pakistanensis TaxID=992287 RepID=A0A919U4I5_9CELL|nr:AraC family transcriptional regulator [Cellulomonas pakistanensis]GIG37526.1 cupin [Cellulomonas pakistanensis]
MSTPPWDARDRLGETLHRLRMRGTFYCHATLADPWALEMPAVPDSVSFHVLVAGSCRVEVAGPDATTSSALGPGDLALVPHGRGHVLRGGPGDGPAPRVDLLPQRYVSPHFSVLRHGGGGAAGGGTAGGGPSGDGPAGDGRTGTTILLCGVVAFDEPAARELLALLPPVVHVSAADPGPTPVADTVRLMAAELAEVRPGGEAIATRLADVLVVQAVRAWLDRDPAARTGWLGALADPQVGRALAAVHAEPGRGWTLDGLAREAAMSRTTFAARFTDLVGEPPMRYVTRWRMALAHDRLRTGDATVAALADALGYRSEAAFSRAFTRTVGRTPGSVRARPAPPS